MILHINSNASSEISFVLSIDFGFRTDGLLMICSKQIKKNLGSLLLTAMPWRNTREYFPFSL